MKDSRPTGKRNLFIFLFVVLISCVFAVFWLAHFGNTPEVFDDVITGNLGIDGTNKSIEFKLLWILLFGGTALYLILSVIAEIVVGKRRDDVGETHDISSESGAAAGEETESDAAAGEEMKDVAKHAKPSLPRLTFSMVCILTFSASLLVQYLMYQSVNAQVLLGLCVLLFATLIKSEHVGETVLFYFLSDMGLMGLYYIAVLFHVRQEPGIDLFSIVAAVCACVFAWLSERYEDLLKRGILTAQLLMAGLLCYLLIDTYYWQQNFISIRPATGVIIATLIGVILVCFEASVKLKTYWHAPANLSEILTISSSVLAFTWLQMTGNGCVVRDDVRHPYECVIGFSQVFLKGQKLYEEYSPTSGLFSLLQGAFLEVLGEGKIANYNTTNVIFYLCIFTLLVICLRLHLKSEYVLLIAMFFSVNTWLENYNRYIFMLPITLLLLYRPLVKKRALWLWCWILTTLLHGLYYPLLGAAVGCGFLPMGLWVLYRHIATKELKRDLKKPAFYAGWAITLVLVGVSIPLLFRMANHILAMAGQTVLADGICMFGENVPSNFMAYLSNNSYSVLRIVAYDCIRFVGLPVFGFVGAALLFTVVKGRKVKDLLNNETIGYRAAFCLYFCIMPPIAYTYTFCRSESGEMFSRGEHVTYVLSILFFIYALTYVRQRRFQYLLLCFALAEPALTSTVGLAHMPAMSAYFRADSSYVYVSKDTILPRLGDCFI
ncbi:MAG: hypothetical protein K6G07_02320, partial [Lachnospiraceae bacterium]|nr:hypothetical protein [Lachnospiraceae bacterium]